PDTRAGRGLPGSHPTPESRYGDIPMMNLTAHLIRTLLIALATLAASGPATARFLSVDPAPVSTTDGSNFNRYWYANNNPYRYVDPDGRHPAAIVACTSSPACVGAVISAAGAIVTG